MIRPMPNSKRAAERRGNPAHGPFGACALLILVGLLAACGNQSNRATPADNSLKIFAAASMTEVVNDLAKEFDAPVTASFGSTSDLARQIGDGAPADVFISANRNWMDELQQRGRIDGEYRSFAGNSLVCVAPANSRLKALKIADPAALLAELSVSGGRAAIATEGVPAGDYTRQSLAMLGLMDHYKQVAAGQKDVRAVLHAVSKGEVEAGFVYATDARITELQVLFAIDSGTHDSIEYYVAAVKGARNAAAVRRFIGHLRGEKGRAVLKQAGFTLPK